MKKSMRVNGMKKVIMAAMAATALAANAGTTGTWGADYKELNYAFMSTVEGSPGNYFSDDNPERLRTDGTIKVFEEAHFFLSISPPSFYGVNGEYTTFFEFYDDTEFFTDFMMNIQDHDTWVAQEYVVWEDNWDYTWNLPSTIDMVTPGAVIDAFVIVILKLSDTFMADTGLGEYVWLGAEATGGSGQTNMRLNFEAYTFWGEVEGPSHDYFNFSYLFPVPEPATGLLALAGIALLVRRKRK